MFGTHSPAQWLSELEPSLDTWIYHYTSAESLGAILSSGCFRLNTYPKMNDPREAKEWVAEQLSFPEGSESLHLEVDRVLRRCARIGSFTADDTPTRGAAAGSLSHRGWARASLWDRYAARHRGVCLVFDQVDLITSVRDNAPLRSGNVTSWGRVTYVDAPVTIPLSGTFSSRADLLEALDDMTTWRGVVGQLYLTKNRDWASEREFRILVVLWDLPEEDLDLPLDVPFGDALKAVVIGEGYGDAESLERILNRRFGDSRPDVVRCRWQGGAPWLEAP